MGHPVGRGVSSGSGLGDIPQEPHLFSGAVRFILDPFASATMGGAKQFEHVDSTYFCGPMIPAVSGQSEMDEVTAAIGFQTDRLIQETIRSSPALRDATIVS